MKKTLVKKQKKDELMTKTYLDERFSSFSNKIINYIDLRLEPIEEKVQKIDSIDKRLESIMKTLDWLAGKYKKFDEEYVVASEQAHRVNGKLDNHEERISTLEQRVVTS